MIAASASIVSRKARGVTQALIGERFDAVPAPQRRLL
jgi:hypothetical protein